VKPVVVVVDVLVDDTGMSGTVSVMVGAAHT
jgi:hypothetical protein